MVLETARRCFLILCLALTAPIHAEESASDGAAASYAPLQDALRSSSLAGVVGLLDTAALARAAGKPGEQIPEALLRRFGTQHVQAHRLYEHPDTGLLLRLELAPQGINWLVLDYDANSPRPIDDWYDQALGTSLSALAAAMGALADDRAGRSFLSSLTDGKGNLPVQRFRQLPALLKSADTARLLVNACTGEPCHAEALLELDRLTGADDDGLWQLDLAVLGRDWRRFERLMTRLETRLGPDPALVWLAANAKLQRKDCRGVLAEVTPAIGRWPGYQSLYPLVTQCYVVLGQYQQAVEYFGQMQERFGLQIDWQALANDPVYAPFVSSGTFRAWQQAR